MRRLWLVAALGLCALVIAAGASFVTSSAPDGLERVTSDLAIAPAQEQAPARRSPLADYTVNDRDTWRARALAGAAGVAATAAVAVVVFVLLSRRRYGTQGR